MLIVRSLKMVASSPGLLPFSTSVYNELTFELLCGERRGSQGASKAYEVFLLFVASNFVRYARIKAGEPGDEATKLQNESWIMEEMAELSSDNCYCPGNCR